MDGAKSTKEKKIKSVGRFLFSFVFLFLFFLLYFFIFFLQVPTLNSVAQDIVTRGTFTQTRVVYVRSSTNLTDVCCRVSPSFFAIFICESPRVARFVASSSRAHLKASYRTAATKIATAEPKS